MHSHLRHQRPLGIFDSGIGGLTVAHAISQVLPGEQFVYFGDTAHLPYGDKSTAAIQAYAVKICDVLLGQKVKLILIACNSASAAAYELVKAYVGSKAHVLNVIDPVVAYVGTHFAGRRVGLIGTKQTIASGVYNRQLEVLGREVELRALATPLLAPMIEEGFAESRISQQVIDTYLSDPALEGIEALILGCTHYPLIRREIEQYYRGRVQVIDSAEVVAARLQQVLTDEGLLRTQRPGAHNFFVSDYTSAFEQSTRLFFRRPARLQAYPLWE